MEAMLGFLQSVLMCTFAGMLLSLLFVTPAGAVLGGVNGCLVGICVGLGERTARRAGSSIGRLP
jgi:hypothetical protein